MAPVCAPAAPRTPPPRRCPLSTPTGAPSPELLTRAHAPLTDVRTALPDAHGPPTDNHPARPGTEDRGSFTHGTCGGCGWSGPGRRARAVAARDAVRHLQTGCAGDVTTAADDHAAR